MTCCAVSCCVDAPAVTCCVVSRRAAAGSNSILIMACDVALGAEWQTKKDKYMVKPQRDSMCTHAMGEHTPVLAALANADAASMPPYHTALILEFHGRITLLFLGVLTPFSHVKTPASVRGGCSVLWQHWQWLTLAFPLTFHCRSTGFSLPSHCLSNIFHLPFH